MFELQPTPEAAYPRAVIYREERWRYAAATLGLRVYLPTESYDVDACFTRLERGRGRPAGTETAGRVWMVGRVEAASQRGVDVIVVPRSEATQSSTHASSTSYADIVARIDPPLFLGLELEAPRPMDPIFGPKFNELTGDPELDRASGITATKAPAAAQLLRRHAPPPNDLLDHLQALSAKARIVISDTAVHYRLPYEDDPAVLGPQIASVAALAASIGARRGRLPRDPAESALVALFRSAAETGSGSGNGRVRLAFDDERLVLSGWFGGVQLRLAVETERTESHLLLALETPRPLDLGLRLTKQGTLQLIAGWFGSQDVKVGDRAFDDAFVIKAKDEPQVKALFGAHPAARAALLELAPSSAELVLDDERLVVRSPGVADPNAVRRLLLAAQAIAPMLAAETQPAQAYR